MADHAMDHLPNDVLLLFIDIVQFSDLVPFSLTCTRINALAERRLDEHFELTMRYERLLLSNRCVEIVEFCSSPYEAPFDLRPLWSPFSLLEEDHKQSEFGGVRQKHGIRAWCPNISGMLFEDRGP